MFEKTSSLLGQELPEKGPHVDHGGNRCHLCGLPTGPDEIKKDTLQFCCPGCREVFLILSGVSGELPRNFRETDLFRACMDAGIIPGKKTLVTLPEEIRIDDGGAVAISLNLYIEGMWCPACAWVIEEVLKRMSGVMKPHVSFFSDVLRLEYLPNLVSPSEIVSHIDQLGYRAHPEREHRQGKSLKKDLLTRLGVSSILAMNVMILSFVLYYGFFRDLTPTVIAYFSYPLMIMTIPVVFYGGMPIFRKAWTGLRYGNISIDTFIAISALSAFFYSIIGMSQGSIHLYFDTAAMLVTIMLIGRYIESEAREKVAEAITFDETGLTKVRLLKEQTEQWVSADAVRPGDRFIVRKEERIPLDGRVFGGIGVLDQSALTGEPAPVAIHSEQRVMAGSLLMDGELEITATRPARESSLRQMTELMTEALERKSSGEKLADSVSRFFVPAVLSIAGVTGLVLWFSGTAVDQIILRCLTILLISCPCTLGIAIPLTKVVIIGLGRKKGLLIRRPEALEYVKGLDVMVLDKTGTVTEGVFSLRHVICDGINESDLFALLGAIESQSSHFLAREVVRYMRSLGAEAKEGSLIEEFDGMGVCGRVDGKMIFTGNRRLLLHCKAELLPALEGEAIMHERKGMTVVFFGWDRKVQGFLVFGDALKEGSQGLVDSLKNRGIKVFLVSGDGDRTTEAVANSLGITEFLGQTLPAEKVLVVKNMQRAGHVVGMAGDGINDSGALAQADVGFAIGPGYPVLQEAADVMILSGKPEALTGVFKLSLLSARTVRQNLAFAFFYNAIAIPVAAAGFLNPLIAVFAMFASSLTVIANVLRIGRMGSEDGFRDRKRQSDRMKTVCDVR